MGLDTWICIYLVIWDLAYFSWFSILSNLSNDFNFLHPLPYNIWWWCLFIPKNTSGYFLFSFPHTHTTTHNTPVLSLLMIEIWRISKWLTVQDGRNTSIIIFLYLNLFELFTNLSGLFTVYYNMYVFEMMPSVLLWKLQSFF